MKLKDTISLKLYLFRSSVIRFVRVHQVLGTFFRSLMRLISSIANLGKNVKYFIKLMLQKVTT